MDKKKKKKGRGKSGIPEVIHIDRHEHAKTIVRRFQEMQEEGTACDFRITVHDQSIAVHRDILCGSSEYFRGLLYHDNSGEKRKELNMLGVDFESVKMCVDFIYGRDVSVDPEKYEDLLFVAHLMQLELLCKAVERSMMENVDTKTTLQYKNAADFYGCKKLKVKCDRFAKIYFHLITEESDFNEIDKNSLMMLMKSKRSKMEEKRKLDVLLSWVKHEKSREANFPDLLEGIDLRRISTEDRQKYVKAEELFVKNSECMKILEDSINDFPDILLEDPQQKMKNFLIFPRNSSNLQLFDPRANRLNEMFVQKCDINVDYSAMIFDDHVFIFAEDKSVFKFCYWDETAKWVRLSDMIEKHGMFPPTTVLSGAIYAIGAFSRGFSTDAVEKYDAVTNQWELLPHKPTKTDGAELVSLHDSIYCIGGWVNGESTPDFIKYVVKTGCWDPLPPMIESRAAHKATKWNDNIIVAGGLNEWRRHKSVELYDTVTQQWTLLSSMNLERVTFNLLISDGCLFAIGGIGKKPASNVIEKYDPEEETWTVLKIRKEAAPKVYQGVAVEVDD